MVCLKVCVSRWANTLSKMQEGERRMSYCLTCGEWIMLARYSYCDSWCEDESHWGLGAGPGIGFELRMLDNVAWSVEIPLAVMIADGEFYGLYPVPNSSLVYYW